MRIAGEASPTPMFHRGPPSPLRGEGQKAGVVMKRKIRTKIEFARELRRKQTRTEEVLWWLLRNNKFLGYKFRRQYVLRGFILDFYCSSARLGIELDGKVHLKQKDYDVARQKYLENYGIKLLRFTNSEVYNEPERVLQTILNHLPPALALIKERGG